MQTIVNIDSNDIRRFGINLMLQEHLPNYNHLESPSLGDFRQQHAESCPRIIILGDDQNALQSTRDFIIFRKHFKDTIFIVYSDLNKNDILDKYLDLGVCGLITMAEAPSELINCVKATLDDKKYLSKLLMECFLSNVFQNEISQPARLPLSRRELQVARHLRNGMKTSWIANYLNLTSSTISTIKRNIFNKLEIVNTEELSEKMGGRFLDR